MPAPEKREVAAERRQSRVADLYCRGWTQRDIAAELKCGQSTISRDLEKIREEWRGSSIRDFDAIKAEQLAKIDLIERNAWAAWDRSCLAASKRTKSSKDIGGKKSTEATIVEENQAGDPRFLAIMLDCVKSRRELLGLDAPKKLEHSGEIDGPGVTLIQLQADFYGNAAHQSPSRLEGPAAIAAPDQSPAG